MSRCSRGRSSTLTDDPFLRPYLPQLKQRRERLRRTLDRLTGASLSLDEFASGHEFFGLHQGDRDDREGWVVREWAPNASSITLVGTFSQWREEPQFALRRLNDHGEWELRLGPQALRHGDLYRLVVDWPGGRGERIPAYARRVVQDLSTKLFSAEVWAPPRPYLWRHEPLPVRSEPLIYEAHIGMAQSREAVGSYAEFRDLILPRIRDAGYDAVQLMAIMEHPYYASFGYQVANFFAASSRFGTPDDLKSLVDRAHELNLSVIMDLVHSHAVRNENEGLSRFDGTIHQYFHEGPRGEHVAWDSRCFDYGKPQVLHFLLSNCRFWLDEYRFDGFRFDGITSMLYAHHGLGVAFDHYDRYFDASVDEDAVTYLTLANQLIHTTHPHAVTIAEDVSGMPGLAAPLAEGGCGFDYRLAMGVPDCWFKLVNDTRDEDWRMGTLWHELTNRRGDERTVSYVESHDQALVGGKSLIFSLIDADMYAAMRRGVANLRVERGMALHKMARLATALTAGHGYLNFMGNEFGHPEWIDFPRLENGWSYHYARRQWHLCDDPSLRYACLAQFDRALMRLVREHDAFGCADATLRCLHEDDKVLAFERGDLLVVLNFHPHRSIVDYPISGAAPHHYQLILDTDEVRFDGQGRLAPAQRYAPQERGQVLVYLPCRVGLVLQRSAAA